MPSPVERFENWMNAWINKARKAWGEPFYRFLLGGSYETIDQLSKITSGGADHLEENLRRQLKPILARLREAKDLPDDMKDILDQAMEEPGWIHLAALLPYIIGMLMGMGMSAAAPLGNLGRYFLDGLVRSARLDPISVITAWRRDPAKYEKLFGDLKDQGWSDDRIEALKFYTLFYPAPADLVKWQAREVFEPEMVERYGLDSEFAGIEKAPFYKAGMTDEQILNYWRAHWEHASWLQVVEMLHRGLLTEQEVYDWFRLVEIPPFWRDKLTQTAYTWPTRVDVRRWWDMRTISEERLRELYMGMGYRDENLEDYIRWTKVYVDFGMMMTRFRNGWITEQDIRDWLKELEIPEKRIQQFMEEKTKPEKGARVAGEKDITATDIIMGVKKGVITWAEGIELLMDLGYDEEEADFKLAVRIETEGGSPANLAEYKRLTQLWRSSQGLPTKMTSAEIKAAEKELAKKYPLKVRLTEEELKVKVDTIRRKRRSRQLTRDQEIAGLLELGLTVELSTAYADNDDLRLRAEKGG